MATSAPAQRFSQSWASLTKAPGTLFKRAVGISMIVGVSAYYLEGCTALRTEYAVLSAPRQTVTVPAPGRLEHVLQRNQIVEGGGPLAIVHRDAALDPELRRAQLELDAIGDEIASIKSLVDYAESLAEQAKDRGRVLRSTRALNLARSVQAADAELKLADADASAAAETSKRSVELCNNGLMSGQACLDVNSRSIRADRAVELAQSKVDLARFALDVAKKGVGVASSLDPTELVYEIQRENQLTLRVADLKRELTARESRQRALKHQMLSADLELRSSGRSLVWNVLRSNSALVGQTEAVAELADCENVFVFGTLPLTKYNRLRVGETARIIVDGQTFEGTIAQLLGAAGSANGVARMLPAPPHRDDTGVRPPEGAVMIQSDALARRYKTGCDIGLSATVSFGDEPRWRSVLAWALPSLR